jgi:hypothetical protein
MKTKNILITIAIIFLILIIGGGVAVFFAVKNTADFVKNNSSQFVSQANSALNSTANSAGTSIVSSVSNSLNNPQTGSVSSAPAIAFVPADPAGEALIRASVDAIDASVKAGDYDTFVKYVDIKSVIKSILNSDPTLDKTTKEITDTYLDEFYSQQEAEIQANFEQGNVGFFNASKDQTFIVKKAGADYVLEVLNPDSASKIPYRMYFKQNPTTNIWQLYQILTLDGKSITDIS